MKLIWNKSTDPYFNLAAEEYLLDHMADSAVMLWRNDNTIVVGRNQNTADEINEEYVREHGIRVVRRLTGGGAVYHNLANVNYTIIQPYRAGLFSNYQYFTRAVQDYLKSLGVDAQLSGRNDLLISGKKFSGNAQCMRNGKVMHHGTLMFGSASADISGALTPNKAKMAAHQVKSVASRVTNISSHLPAELASSMDVIGFLKGLYIWYQEHLADAQPYEWTAADKADIQRLADFKYATRAWNFGSQASAADTLRRTRKYPFGLVDIQMLVKNGRISRISIAGDFFGILPVAELEKKLVGSKLQRETLAAVFSAVPVDRYISGMTQEDLILLLLGNI